MHCSYKVRQPARPPSCAASSHSDAEIEAEIGDAVDAYEDLPDATTLDVDPGVEWTFDDLIAAEVCGVYIQFWKGKVFINMVSYREPYFSL